MASIILLGLEDDLADNLMRVLRQQKHETAVAGSIHAAEIRDADIIFAGGDAADYRETVGRLTEMYPQVPVVVVNRHPDNARWLDALELGAADYCGAPFEPIQVRWVLDSAMRHAVAA